MSIQSHIVSLVQHFFPALRPTPQPVLLHETQLCRELSRMMGTRAAQYVAKAEATPEEYETIRFSIRRKIMKDAFNIDEFNRGYNNVTGGSYDFDSEAGDVFKIAEAYHDKETPQAVPKRQPLMSYRPIAQ